MAKAKSTFHDLDPATGKVTIYRPGQKVPDAVAGRVGAHLLDGPRPVLTADLSVDGDVSEALQGAQAQIAELVAAVTERDERIAALEAELEEALDAATTGGDDDPTGDLDDLDPDAEAPVELFDPSKHDVDEVLAHLEKSDEAEYTRVVELEGKGKARKGILGG
ncbi:hypothetical protein [Aeromicrobium sp. Leaf291]|uniref:hypothetical protein n=1 Tax=Aeromicrobium sp. Leaf291 TaxID=1736325 RepID=UPI0007019FD1|nr:hypothetical protein [Aeromicrobium sp. Leaf291]KQP81579.1 hypothetical protein ASF35_16240 [Aeromicrobium sp. Leaf291]